MCRNVGNDLNLSVGLSSAAATTSECLEGRGGRVVDQTEPSDKWLGAKC